MKKLRNHTTILTAIMALANLFMVAPTALAFDCNGYCKPILKNKKMIDTQVGSHCKAYLGLNEAKTPEIAILGMDAAVAAVCGYACAVQMPQSYAFCSYGAIGAGVAEIAYTYMQKSGVLAKLLGSSTAATGGALGVKGANEYGEQGNRAKRLGKDGIELGKEIKATEKSANLADMGEDGAEEVAALREQGDKLKAKQRKTACLTAAAFAITAGIRAYNLTKYDTYRKEACENVEKLATSQDGQPVSVPDFQTGPSPIPNTGSSGIGSDTTSGAESNLGADTTTASSPSSDSDPTDDSGTTEQSENLLNCIAGQGSNGCLQQDYIDTGSQSAATAMATDTGLLARTGVDRIVAPIARNNMNIIKASMNRGQLDAGSIIAAMSAGSLGRVGFELTQLARFSQQHAPELLGVATPSSRNSPAYQQQHYGVTQSGDTSYNSTNQPGSAALTHNTTSGDMASAVAIPPPAPQAVDDDDIWHSNATGSIFQIVSNKLVKTRGRVEMLEWSTKLNRAITGLPAK
ncbi:MAG: hypothetical protein AABZ06_12020 [Bdellovibrionota bacterium]